MCRGAYVLMFEEAGEGHPGVLCHLSPPYSLEMGLVVKLELVIRQAAVKPQYGCLHSHPPLLSQLAVQVGARGSKLRF